jgi:hypothetical protein
VSIKELTRSDFNAMSLHEREFVGRFMDYERLKVLQRHRDMAHQVVKELDDEIKRCAEQLEKWPRHKSCCRTTAENYPAGSPAELMPADACGSE